MTNINVDYFYNTEMTDAAPVVTREFKVREFDDLVVDIVTDKGSTVVITPILADGSTDGKPSDTVTIADSGDTERIIYSKISSQSAKVVVTKTEAGTTSGFTLAITGINGSI